MYQQQNQLLIFDALFFKKTPLLYHLIPSFYPLNQSFFLPFVKGECKGKALHSFKQTFLKICAEKFETI
jgi:hypothetical protein